ncbi:T9SS type A sorting domain-containing protein [candidate division WOR-3 bacterium]|nr:T9SS type A sorting domain-containing protein [candidate division WOR-3 bacterium]
MILRRNIALTIWFVSIIAFAQGIYMSGTGSSGSVIDAHGEYVNSDIAGLDAPALHQSEVILHQNIPNPFTRATMIRFVLPWTGYARLSVYDLIGQEVARLVDGELPAGSHSVTLDGRDLPDGVYFYRLTFEEVNRTKLCLLLK